MNVETPLIDPEDQDRLRDRAEMFVAGLDRLERVIWLQHQRISDVEILDALLEGAANGDSDIRDYAIQVAHQIVSAVADGSRRQAPDWLGA